jgi:hypothetical protein
VSLTPGRRRIPSREKLTRGAASETREAYDALDGLSMSTMRRLDAAADDVRERRAALAAAARMLEELARERGETVRRFGEDAAAVGRAARERANAGAEALEAQVRRLEGLAARMRESERRAEAVRGRLEMAGEKVEAFEGLEAEVQASISCESASSRVVLEVLTRGSPVSDCVGDSGCAARCAICAVGFQHVQHAGGPGGHAVAV